VNDARSNMRKERLKCPFASRRPQRNDGLKPSLILPSKGTQYSLSTLAEHSCKVKGYWVELNNNILDISKFIKKHKGSEDTLLAFVGSSVTEEYRRIHSDNQLVYKQVEKLKIGKLVEPVFTQ